MKIEVAISLGPRKVLVTHLDSDHALVVSQAKTLALEQLNLGAHDPSDWAYAVWGKRVEKTTELKDGDRLELLRPLKVDPKEARRLRFDQQGSRAAGLFAKRRKGAKAGY